MAMRFIPRFHNMVWESDTYRWTRWARFTGEASGTVRSLWKREGILKLK